MRPIITTLAWQAHLLRTSQGDASLGTLRDELGKRLPRSRVTAPLLHRTPVLLTRSVQRGVDK